jgi:hypothetical protein
MLAARENRMMLATRGASPGNDIIAMVTPAIHNDSRVLSTPV